MVPKIPNQITPQANSADRGSMCGRRVYPGERSELAWKQGRNTPTSHGNAARIIDVAPTAVRDLGAAGRRAVVAAVGAIQGDIRRNGTNSCARESPAKWRICEG